MKISEEVGSKYRFIILSGQRVSQLQRGAKPRLEHPEKTKMTQIAMNELAEGKLTFRKIDLEARDNPTPEVKPEPPAADAKGGGAEPAPAE